MPPTRRNARENVAVRCIRVAQLSHGGVSPRRRDSVSTNVDKDLRESGSHVVPTMVPTTSHQSASVCTVDDTNLRFIATVWPSLPAAVKAGIMAMVQAVDGASSDADSVVKSSDVVNRSKQVQE